GTAGRSAGVTVRGTPRGVAAVGVVVTDVGRSALALSSVSVATGRGTFRLAGLLHDAVTPPHWRYDATHQGWGFFTDTTAKGWLWTRSPSGGPPPPATTRIVRGPAYDPATVEVRSPRPVELVRSVSFAPGWTAAERPTRPGAGRRGQAGTTVPVRADGPVQAVDVPAGDHLVTFTYHPLSVSVGLYLSGAGAAALVTGSAWELTDGRRRRSRASKRHHPSATRQARASREST
ncbi:MAG: hypothetical protein ACRDZY_03230, partial [Acidimicrobiales bacterium]